MTEDLTLAIAERCLNKICETLGLDYGQFDRAEDATRKALDGEADKIISDQIHRAVDALARMSDPLMRARIVELVVAFAETEKTSSAPEQPSEQLSNRHQRQV